MKTFAEAMTILCQPVDSPAQAEQKFERMADVMEKYTPLAQEIGANEDIWAFVSTFVKPDVPPAIKSMLVNVFINGVIVGLEMCRPAATLSLSKEKRSNAGTVTQ